MTDKSANGETTLPADATALVATAVGGFELVLANGTDDAEVPPNVQLLVAVLLRSKDAAWVGEMLDWLKKQKADE
ncbi:hypothetical protein [Yoonia sp. 2307UL14-13]|uniref:hypothetical protein n=1 Tax=Yoonia sp. 2307UL14-13 TaxID=3126506 RepID=UPI0030B2337D